MVSTRRSNSPGGCRPPRPTRPCCCAPAQSGLARAERLRNLSGAFAVEPLRAEKVRGKRIVLVDDVMTSGASLFVAAEALRLAGAAHITAVVLARTDPPR